MGLSVPVVLTRWIKVDKAGAHLTPKCSMVALSMSSNSPCIALQAEFLECAQHLGAWA